MAKRKKDISAEVAEIKKLLEKEKVIIGTKETIKQLKLGKIAKVFLSSNTPKEVKEDIEYYSKLGKVEVVKLEQLNVDLGTVCRKPFPISVLSVSRE